MASTTKLSFWSAIAFILFGILYANVIPGSAEDRDKGTFKQEEVRLEDKRLEDDN